MRSLKSLGTLERKIDRNGFPTAFINEWSKTWFIEVKLPRLLAKLQQNQVNTASVSSSESGPPTNSGTMSSSSESSITSNSFGNSGIALKRPLPTSLANSQPAAARRRISHDIKRVLCSDLKKRKSNGHVNENSLSSNTGQLDIRNKAAEIQEKIEKLLNIDSVPVYTRKTRHKHKPFPGVILTIVGNVYGLNKSAEMYIDRNFLPTAFINDWSKTWFKENRVPHLLSQFQQDLKNLAVSESSKSNLSPPVSQPSSN